MTRHTIASSCVAEPRRVVMLGYDGAQILDITGPMQIFAAVAEAGGKPGYSIELTAPRAGKITTSCGLTLGIERSIEAFTPGDLAGVDTFLISGGPGIKELAGDSSVVRFVRDVAAAARRTASVCTGAILLAEAGRLNQRRAATHWAYVDAFRERYPAVELDADAIFVRDGEIWSSAGVTAGMDLALAMVEADHGREVARTIARHLVMFLMRPGGQSQYSMSLAARIPDEGRIGTVCAYVMAHPDADLSVSVLAGRAAMSERGFARHFKAETGMTPADFVERARLDLARRLLCDGDLSLDRVAGACGFGTAERMRRTFIRHLAITPGAYRNRFRTSRADPSTLLPAERNIHVH